LRESLRLLQMDRQSLADEIRHEAEVNPVLEVDSDGVQFVSEAMATDDASRESQQSEDDVSFDDYNPYVSYDEAAAERRQQFFDRQVAEESLQEHLIAQVRTCDFTDEDMMAAEFIVGDIDDDGRFIGSLSELAMVLGCSDRQLEGVLRRVQGFDPPGVAGRDLKECLRIQARQLEVSEGVRSALLRIIDECLEGVARSSHAEMASRLEISEADCQRAVKVLKSLDPRPGRQFHASGSMPVFVRPELRLLPGADGEGVRIVSCFNDLPTVSINVSYSDMASDSSTSEETRKYLQERMAAARRLMDAIQRRGDTIMRIAEAVFAIQGEFLAKGLAGIRPLTITDVAKRTGFHGTTVGRAVHGKYIQTPHGLFELSSFFCVGRLDREAGAAVSATAVKRRLRQLLAAEDDTVLTDGWLSEELSRDGVRISRRTVSKYRAALGIPSAAERSKRKVRQTYEHAL